MPLQPKYLVLPLALAASMAGAAPAPAPVPAYQVVARQVLKGPVRWDYLSVDSAGQRVYLTRGDQVDVFDVTAKSVIGSVVNTPGVHGVALAAERDRGYTSNGGNETVTVFALSTLKEVTTVKVGHKPDGIIYDPKTARIFVANGKDNSISVIDASSNKVIKTIALAGKPETAVLDGKGHLYIALEDKNAIAVIDTNSSAVLHQYDVSAGCDEPAGLAIDPAAMHLFAGCHNGVMAILDAVTGKMLALPAIGKGNDASAFDPERKLAFASNGDGTLTVIDGAAPYHVVQTVATMARARTMALDPVSHSVYLVSAEAASDTPPPANARPSLKPDTFTLLTVAPR